MLFFIKKTHISVCTYLSEKSFTSESRYEFRPGGKGRNCSSFLRFVYPQSFKCFAKLFPSHPRKRRISVSRCTFVSTNITLVSFFSPFQTFLNIQYTTSLHSVSPLTFHKIVRVLTGIETDAVQTICKNREGSCLPRGIRCHNQYVGSIDTKMNDDFKLVSGATGIIL